MNASTIPYKIFLIRPSGDIGTLPGSVQLTLKADKKKFVAHQKYYPLNYEERDRPVDTGVLAPHSLGK